MNKLEKVTSYGFISVDSYVSRPENYDEIAELFNYAVEHHLKVCPVGSNLSFSNVALLNKHISLDLKQLNKIILFDIKNQTILVQGGTKTTDILKLTLAHNLTLVGLTGSYGNTVAGNISNDVNGKDTWRNGSFSNNVEEMKVMLSSGDIMQISRTKNSDIFHAVTGGLGLIAVILEVKIKLQSIPGYTIQTETIKCRNLEEQMIQFQSLETKTDDFAYAWTDGFANENQLGRGLFEKGRFIENKNTGVINWDDYLKQRSHILGVRMEHFWRVIRTFYKPTVHQIAGYAKYHKPLFSSKAEIIFPKYQYPMTKYFPQWNLLFYPHGFRELQFIFSIENFENAYIEILVFCKKSKIQPYICAIKKHRKEQGFLSFSNEGLSFTINFGLKNLTHSELLRIQNSLVEICMKHNGIMYLGKFPFITAYDFKSMYPKHVDFLSVKNKVDKLNLLWSDAASNFLI